MADEEDLKLLHSGEKDLTKCDFRNATLSDMNLQGRNFTGVLLNQADVTNTDFSDSIFHEAEVTNLKANKARFNRVSFGRVFVYVDFSEANLQNTNFERAHFSGVNFNGADISGADFRRAKINEGTTFENVIFDENTLFDEVTILRSQSRSECFKYYYFDKGKLHRKSIDVASISMEKPNLPKPSPIILAVNKKSILVQLLNLQLLIDKELSLLGNKPNEPERLKDWEKKVEFLSDFKDGLSEVSKLLDEAQSEVNQEIFEQSSSLLQKVGIKVEDWFSSNSDKLVDWTAKLGVVAFFVGLMNLMGAEMTIATAAIFSKVCPEAITGAVNMVKSRKS